MYLKIITALCVAFLALILGGCERADDVDSPKHLLTDGVVFDYPGNWDIKQNEMQKTGRSIMIRSPGSAMVMIRIFLPNVHVNLTDYAHQIGAGMEKGLAQAAQAAILITPGQSVTYNDVTKPGDHDVSLHYSIKLAGVDDPTTMVFREKTIGSNQVIATVAVSDTHADQAQPGFDLIMATLKPAR